MRTVCEVLGVARSAAVVKRVHSSGWRDGRRVRVTDDGGLVEGIQAHVAHRPTYGYRRIWTLRRPPCASERTTIYGAGNFSGSQMFC